MKTLNKNFYLKFFKNKITNSLNTSTKTFLFSKNFEYITYSEFNYFFILNNLTIPKCFANSKSLYKNNYLTNILKLNNYLTKNGNRYKFVKILTNVLNNVFYQNFKFNSSWKHIYIYLNHNIDNYTNFLNKLNISTNFFSQSFESKSIKLNNFNKNTIFNFFKKISPIFIFYIYKLNKVIYKNTRGKMGKYLFLWKYVPSYKRSSLVIYWLLRELKVRSGKNLSNKLNSIISSLITNPNELWISKIKIFSHNYVYHNAQKTLFNSYRTVKK